MKAYWIARVNVNNKEAYSQYAKRVSSALKKYNGKFLVRGGKFSILEGKHEYERNVLIEFPSFEIAKVHCRLVMCFWLYGASRSLQILELTHPAVQQKSPRKGVNTRLKPWPGDLPAGTYGYFTLLCDNFY